MMPARRLLCPACLPTYLFLRWAETQVADTGTQEEGESPFLEAEGASALLLTVRGHRMLLIPSMLQTSKLQLFK